MSTQTPIADQGAAAQAVLAEVTAILVDVIGANVLLHSDVGMHTRFQDDLCLESIQFVILAEELRARYRKVDFIGWLAGMDLDALVALRVGELVDLIISSADGGRNG